MPSVLSHLTAAASLLGGLVLAYDATVCGTDGHHSKGNKFAFYPNSWNPEDGGFTCMGVNEDPPEFDVTWKWPNTKDTVNSYPHIKFQNTRIPSSIGNITSLKLKASWGIGDGNDAFPVGGINIDDAEELGVRCNIGWDMFASLDVEAAQVEVDASTEIMIWLGYFDDPWPLGYQEPPAFPTQRLGDMEFNLYEGENERGQRVLTYISTETITDFDADVQPLIQYLLDENLVDGNEIMGLVEFGSEAFYATDNITFSAYNMDAVVESNDPENAAVSIAQVSFGLAFGAFFSAALFLL